MIPEIGINHEGSLQAAKEMVDAAHRAGARIIKHQTHIVEDEMSAAAKCVVPGNSDVSIYEVIERCALFNSPEPILYAETPNLSSLTAAALEKGVLKKTMPRLST